MKQLVLITLLLLPTTASALSRYLVAPSCDGGWADTDCWSLTDGGVGGVSAPTSADDVFFTSMSGNQNIGLNTVNRAALSLTVSGTYAGTLTCGSNSLTVSGNVTLITSLNQSCASGSLVVNATSTIDTNGEVWSGLMQLGGSGATITLSEDIAVTGLLTLGSSGTTTINGFAVNMSGGLTTSGVATIITGTTVMTFVAAGGWNSAHTTGSLRSPVTYNCSCTVTLINGGTIRYRDGTLTHTAGTIVSTNNTFVQAAAGASYVSNVSNAGMNFGTFSNLGGNATFSGNFGVTIAAFSDLLGGATYTFQSGKTYTISSSLIHTATSASHGVFVASATTANLCYQGSTIALVYVNFTNVLASCTVLQTYQGTLSGTTTGVTSTTTIPTGSGGGGIIGG